MKKLALLLACMFFSGELFPMVRAGVDVGPQPVEGGYYYDGWYGPGYYYGVYYSDYPSYYAWRRRYYYGGPYYYRRHHRSYHHRRHHGHH